MISTITVAGQSVNLVALPATPGFAGVEFDVEDAVAIVRSPFTGQTQAQAWPGADRWSGTLTLPQLEQCDADAWLAALMQLRGMMNAMQIGNPLKASPRGGVASTTSSPAIPGTVTDAAGGTVLHTVGWQASTPELLLPGDYVQVGYRLHCVLDAVSSDGSGNAALNVWPSLREAPTAGAPVIVTNCVGLFRLASNKRGWKRSWDSLTQISFQVQEYR